MLRKCGLSPMLPFLVLVSTSRERGLLVGSGGWDSALALWPSGCVTMCRFLALAEPLGDAACPLDPLQTNFKERERTVHLSDTLDDA